MRRALAVLSATSLAIFTIAIAPHLVHHAFEPGHIEPDCPFTTAAERVPADTAAVVTVSTVDTVPAHVTPPPYSGLPSITAAPVVARAPPLSVA